MPSTSPEPKAECSNGRSHMLVRILFGLLVLHFVLVYTAPKWLLIEDAASIRRNAFASAPPRQSLFGPGHPRRWPGTDRVKSEGDRRLLWAGHDCTPIHFDVTRSHLDPQQLRYGLGREHFHALIEPTFESMDEADWMNDDTRVICVSIAGDTRVYPIDLLQGHEVVNDVVGDVPIFAAFCVLANLGAVYDRRMNDHPLTFAVSGYTYSDADVWDGMDAFVLWDRDTESLWWPPLGKAVSGPLIDRPMRVLDQKQWAQTTWGEVRRKHDHVVVLRRGQHLEPPTNFPRYEADGLSPPGDASTGIPPRWGENSEL